MIVSIISQGMVWAILGLGIFMTFRILNFPDMTTEGSFPLGGAVAVTLITQGVNPFLATLAAVGAGCLAGMATGLLYTKGKIPTLLSGILVMTSCHSIMLMIMGRANLGLLGTKQIQDFLPFDSDLNQLLTGLIFVALVIGLMLFFLDTKLGQAYIATGDNPDMAHSPIECFVTIANELRAYRMRAVAPEESLTYSFGCVEGGHEPNIIPEELTFAGTARCTKNEDGPEPKPVQPQDDPIKETPIKELSFITQEKTLEDYDKWVYVNLETGETVMKEN